MLLHNATHHSQTPRGRHLIVPWRVGLFVSLKVVSSQCKSPIKATRRHLTDIDPCQRKRQYKLCSVHHPLLESFDVLNKKNKNLKESNTLDDTRGLITAHHGVAVMVRFSDKTPEMVRVPRNSGFLVGDAVFEQNNRLQREERTTELKRATTAGQTLSVAANIDFVGIVVAPKPQANLRFVDQVVIATQAAGIQSILVMNKNDLPDFPARVSILRVSPHSLFVCLVVWYARNDNLLIKLSVAFPPR